MQNFLPIYAVLSSDEAVFSSFTALLAAVYKELLSS